MKKTYRIEPMPNMCSVKVRLSCNVHMSVCMYICMYVCTVVSLSCGQNNLFPGKFFLLLASP